MNDDFVVFKRNNRVAILNKFTMKKYFFNKQDESEITNLIGNNKSIKDGDKDYIKTKSLNTIQLAVTTKCNLNCSYCQLYKNTSIDRINMKVQEVENILMKYENVFANGTVIITGGEPLINWKAVEVIVSASSGRKIIFTNGLLLDAQKIRFLNDNRVFIIVSSDGDAKENISSRKMSTLSFKKVDKTLRNLKTNGARFGISLVINEHNFSRLDKIIDWMYVRYQPDSFGINIPHYTKRYSWSLPIEEIKEQFIRLFHFSKNKNIFIDPISRYLSPLVNEKLKYHDCSSCGEKVVVYPNGIESNCIIYGLIFPNAELEIWDELSPLTNPECKDCFAIGICGGPCIFDGSMYFGENSFDFRRCEIIKALVEEMIWDIDHNTPNISPSKSELFLNYKNLINNPTNSIWSIGHD